MKFSMTPWKNNSKWPLEEESFSPHQVYLLICTQPTSEPASWKGKGAWPQSILPWGSCFSPLQESQDPCYKSRSAQDGPFPAALHQRKRQAKGCGILRPGSLEVLVLFILQQTGREVGALSSTRSWGALNAFPDLDKRRRRKGWLQACRYWFHS